jgi:hypothetical protein
MTTPTARAAARLFQGHRDPIRSTACLLCRASPSVCDAARFRRLFAETGICGACHDALDAWSAAGQETDVDAMSAHRAATAVQGPSGRRAA